MEFITVNFEIMMHFNYILKLSYTEYHVAHCQHSLSTTKTMNKVFGFKSWRYHLFNVRLWYISSVRKKCSLIGFLMD